MYKRLTICGLNISLEADFLQQPTKIIPGVKPGLRTEKPMSAAFRQKQELQFYFIVCHRFGTKYELAIMRH
jgi:hypothetical protein